MATNYPTSLDSFTNPSPGSTLSSPSHSGQHSDINDAMEAVQAKLGVGGTAVGKWTQFTPSWVNFTPGSAVDDWYYAVVNDVLFVEGRVTLASDSVMSTHPGFYVPNGYTIRNTGQPFGLCHLSDSGTAYVGSVIPSASNRFRFTEDNVSGSSIIRGAITNVSPFTWTNGDEIRAAFQARLT